MGLAGHLCTDSCTKNDEKGYFFQAGVCASLSPFRLKEKNAIILVGKVVFFINLLTRCDYWVISQINHYILISQNRFFDILRSFWYFSS